MLPVLSSCESTLQTMTSIAPSVAVLVMKTFPGGRYYLESSWSWWYLLPDPFRRVSILLNPQVCKVSHMTIYISLGNLSRDAFAHMDTLEDRDRKAKKLIESLGGKLISLHYTFGRYDFVAMVDMPSKESMVKFLTILGKHGTVKTETLETIPSETLYKIAKEV